ncbi:Disulfide oxidoreductase YuzD [Salinibacillus kushneri]|uniref:Disulfide oxidoreductase YuzD n=1 Tax=Salinibacillus kushneri TaxID=237682 RepID=A0A1H9Y9B9_9BACI|nr:YuzD family protein [Salinibacillus kushneri]SES64989.1 Disulfide oxidoreductase YuzD [Salinibacillus kushneri]
MEEPIKVTVYGADQICASCVNAPGSKDTYEWLQAAISRKFGNANIKYSYVDIFSPPENKKIQELAGRVVEEEFFYPLVIVDDEIAGEGNPRLKTIYSILEEKGLQPEM